ncbi:MAG: S-adenosylmethionine:tRNA ribosyltransferase-isomerase, partial [Bacteriovoracaceae bacterium]
KKIQASICEITDRGSFIVHFTLEENQKLIQFLEIEGMIPLPPYIRNGESDEQDKKDYQTVFATNPGSVAAPTAGLHFSEDIFRNLKDKKHDYDFIDLHVGVGTFKPIETKNILEHKMHQEFFEIKQELIDKINKKSRTVIPVGTTSFRVLQSHFELRKNQGMTQCYVYPGKSINPIISGLITNFHLPKSSLLVLVAALIGREKALELYEIAKSQNYRFYSYGDAMLILLR